MCTRISCIDRAEYTVVSRLCVSLPFIHDRVSEHMFGIGIAIDRPPSPWIGVLDREVIPWIALRRWWEKYLHRGTVETSSVEYPIRYGSEG